MNYVTTVLFMSTLIAWSPSSKHSHLASKLMAMAMTAPGEQPEIFVVNLSSKHFQDI